MKKLLKKIIISFVLVMAIFSAPVSNVMAQTPAPNVGAPSANAGTIAGSDADGNIFYRAMMKAASEFILKYFYLIYVICALILFLAGIILNLIIELTVIGMSSFMPSAVINDMWVIFRDLANTVFLFVLLYGAIQIMLGIGGTTIKKLITNVVIAAIVVNFSLFATKVAIDFSNILSLAMYNQIMGNQKTVSVKETFVGLSGLIPVNAAVSATQMHQTIAKLMTQSGGGLAGKYVDATQILKSARITGDVSRDIASLVMIPVKLLVNSIFLVIADALLFSVAVVFLIRFVVVVFLMILSPLAFVGFIVPALKSKLTSKWIEHLTSAVFFPPTFFLLVYLSLKVIHALSVTNTMPPEGNIVSDIISVGISLTISGFFLTIPLIAATVFGIKGGEFMTGFTNKISGGIKNGVKRTGQRLGSIAGRNSAGRIGELAEKKFKNSKLMNFAPMRELRAATTQKMAEGKYGGKSLKDVRDAAKKTTEIHKGIDSRREFEANLQTHETDVSTLEGLNDDIRRADLVINSTDPAVTAAQKTAAQARKTAAQAAKVDPEKRVTVVKDYIDGLSNQELKDMNDTIKKNPSLGRYLSDSKLAAMAKDPELADSVGEIYDDRVKKLKAAIAASDWNGAANEAGKLTPTALNKLSPGEKMKLVENAGHIFKGKMYEEVTKEMTIDNKREFDTAWSNFFIANPAKITDAKLRGEDVIRFSNDALMNPGVIKNLTQDHLAKIATAEKDSTVLHKILEVVTAPPIPATPTTPAIPAHKASDYITKGAAGEYWSNFL